MAEENKFGSESGSPKTNKHGCTNKGATFAVFTGTVAIHTNH